MNENRLPHDRLSRQADDTRADELLPWLLRVADDRRQSRQMQHRTHAV